MNPFPEFAVLSQVEAENLVRSEKGKWNVVSIYSGGGGIHGGETPFFHQAKHYCRSLLPVRFHDIDRAEGELILCNQDHIFDILNFAQEKRGQPLLVHCWAGISRSAAVMVLILLDALQKESEFPVEDALGMVYVKRPICQPNRHILHLGLSIISRGDQLTEVRWARELYNSADFKRIYG